MGISVGLEHGLALGRAIADLVVGMQLRVYAVPGLRRQVVGASVKVGEIVRNLVEGPCEECQGEHHHAQAYPSQ